MGRFEEGKSCPSLWIPRCSGEQAASQKLSGMVAVIASLTTGTEQDVDEVDTVCVNEGECTGVRVCAGIPGVMAKL